MSATLMVYNVLNGSIFLLAAHFTDNSECLSASLSKILQVYGTNPQLHEMSVKILQIVAKRTERLYLYSRLQGK